MRRNVAAAVVMALVAAGFPVEAAASPPSTIAMPQLVGSYWVEVEPVLRSHGWAGVLEKGPDATAPTVEDRNRILAQDPPAGQEITLDSTIYLQFGA